jgi:ubiquinol-cytochrome c reductase cytochrome b subunit
MLAVAGILFLVGGLIQINPIWEWGPYHPYLSENGAQPDWYIGWLIGALRLMPNWEPAIGSHTIVPNPFWGGVAFPLFVFGVLFVWPWAERRLTGDHRRHDLLDRPRDHPVRTGLAAGFLSWVGLIFFVGASDRRLPIASAQRRASAALLAGRGPAPRRRWQPGARRSGP